MFTRIGFRTGSRSVFPQADPAFGYCRRDSKKKRVVAGEFGSGIREAEPGGGSPGGRRGLSRLYQRGSLRKRTGWVGDRWRHHPQVAGGLGGLPG